MGRPCIFGEVLFDHFPDGSRVLGGAPFNVAWHLQAFGRAPHFISRIGSDEQGEQIRRAMADWGMDLDGLQIDDTHPTGRVTVEIVDDEPRYDIVSPVAYDRIGMVPDMFNDCGLLYHGSLALRDDISRHTFDEALLPHGAATLFVDVNLRPPWWRREQVLGMVDRAHWVKLNADELTLLAPADGAAAFVAEHRLQGLILTRGGDGAEVLTADGRHSEIRPEADIQIVDTVGAGDAFASVMMLGLSSAWPLEITLQRAQAFASALVGRRGATVSDKAFYRSFIDDWQLEH